jgi:hypothetical protein
MSETIFNSSRGGHPAGRRAEAAGPAEKTARESSAKKFPAIGNLKANSGRLEAALDVRQECPTLP